MNDALACSPPASARSSSSAGSSPSSVADALERQRAKARLKARRTYHRKLVRNCSHVSILVAEELQELFLAGLKLVYRPRASLQVSGAACSGLMIALVAH